jgi:ferritin-like metal-binding protein YciE
MKLDTLNALYVSALRDLYSAETQLLRALPRLHAGATSPALKEAFAEHLELTTDHTARLERLCYELGVSPLGHHCKGMEGVLAEGAELLKHNAEPMVRDAGLLAAAQLVEHYAMASYGAARTYAQVLGFDKQAIMLHTALLEERATDAALTDLSRSINRDAMTGPVHELRLMSTT